MVPATEMWDNAQAMAQTIRMAEYLAKAQIIPQAYQANPGNCLIAIDLGRRMNISPMVVMQNSQIVYGNFSWKGSACRAMIDGCGKYENSRYETVGAPGSPDWGCRLVAEKVKTHTTVSGPWVTMKMAQDEGWFSKNGSKWRTMPELMMRYRAASFFAKTECPEVLMGFQTAEEIQDTFAPDMSNADIAEQPAVEAKPYIKTPAKKKPAPIPTEEESQVSLSDV